MWRATNFNRGGGLWPVWGGLFCGVDLLEELLYGDFELAVDALNHSGGVVGNLEVGLKLRVFEICAFGGAVADDGDAEDERFILKCLPVD